MQSKKKKTKKYKYKCPSCGKYKLAPGLICYCEVAPKYDPDYEDYK